MSAITIAGIVLGIALVAWSSTMPRTTDSDWPRTIMWAGIILAGSCIGAIALSAL